MNAPVLSLSSASVKQGGKIKASIRSMDQATESITAYAVASDNRSFFNDYSVSTASSGRKTVTLSTAGMKPGTYKLTVTCQANGRSPGYASAMFTVKGVLEEPDILACPLLKSKDALTFTVEGLNASEVDSWQVDVFSMGDSAAEEDWQLLESWYSTHSNQNTFTIGADRLQSNCGYAVRVLLCGENYEDQVKQACFYRLGKRFFQLPGGLKYIQAGAFYQTNPSVIVVPEGAKSIAAQAFAQCKNQGTDHPGA